MNPNQIIQNLSSTYIFVYFHVHVLALYLSYTSYRQVEFIAQIQERHGIGMLKAGVRGPPRPPEALR